MLQRFPRSAQFVTNREQKRNHFPIGIVARRRRGFHGAGGSRGVIAAHPGIEKIADGFVLFEAFYDQFRDDQSNNRAELKPVPGKSERMDQTLGRR